MLFLSSFLKVFRSAKNKRCLADANCGYKTLRVTRSVLARRCERTEPPIVVTNEVSCDELNAWRTGLRGEPL